ncbi:MAG: protein translocase subunit SecF [Actinobacteria bacterium]|nr:protein translocase subunit SecF [Actinomycetota bacterium]
MVSRKKSQKKVKKNVLPVSAAKSARENVQTGMELETAYKIKDEASGKKDLTAGGKSVYGHEGFGRFDFIGKNRYWVIVTTVIILTGIVFFFAKGFNFGIDFLGGNLMEVKFKQSTSIDELRKEMESIGYGKAILQNTDADRYIIRTTPLTDEQKELIINTLDESIGIERPLIQDRNVAPGFSKTITRNALIAVAISLVGILIYIWIRFSVRFAIVAIIELLHDILLIFSFYLIAQREFNTTSIAVMLTILGYSLSDAIVIFDRIREELRINKRDSFPLIVNYSLNKILVRSLTTTATTIFPVIVLVIIGNETLKDFSFGLLVGILSGTYSSIFIGAPILIAWNKRFPKYKK